MIIAKFFRYVLFTIEEKFIGSITSGQIIEERYEKKCQSFIYNPLFPDYKSNRKYL